MAQSPLSASVDDARRILSDSGLLEPAATGRGAFGSPTQPLWPPELSLGGSPTRETWGAEVESPWASPPRSPAHRARRPNSPHTDQERKLRRQGLRRLSARVGLRAQRVALHAWREYVTGRRRLQRLGPGVSAKLDRLRVRPAFSEWSAVSRDAQRDAQDAGAERLASAEEAHAAELAATQAHLSELLNCRRAHGVWA